MCLSLKERIIWRTESSNSPWLEIEPFTFMPFYQVGDWVLNLLIYMCLGSLNQMIQIFTTKCMHSYTCSKFFVMMSSISLSKSSYYMYFKLHSFWIILFCLTKNGMLIWKFMDRVMWVDEYFFFSSHKCDIVDTCGRIWKRLFLNIWCIFWVLDTPTNIRQQP